MILNIDLQAGQFRLDEWISLWNTIPYLRNTNHNKNLHLPSPWAATTTMEQQQIPEKKLKGNKEIQTMMVYVEET
jgi:hypothetical protein